jgi:hypothetical protein
MTLYNRNRKKIVLPNLFVHVAVNRRDKLIKIGSMHEKY